MQNYCSIVIILKYFYLRLKDSIEHCLYFSTIDYTMINFLFVDSYQNESLSNMFTVDSQGFIHTLVVLDRELQSNYTLSLIIYDTTLKSYSLPTNVIIQVLDENDNLPYEPFLSNPFDLSIEQIGNEDTVIYEFKPIDLDDGSNGLVSIECLNCSSSYYFHLTKNNYTNSTILTTKLNLTVPDGMYAVAFLLRDHGLPISRERFYTLKFNITHRSMDEETDENFYVSTSSLPFIARQKSIFSRIFLQKSQWHFLLLLIISWLILVITALWTCYRYDRISRKKEQEQKQKQKQFEIQVRKHEVINPPLKLVPKTSILPSHSQKPHDKETLTHDEDEIEDTSYDADHIITDANFVLTSGCATNEPNIRCVSPIFPNEYMDMFILVNTSIMCQRMEI